MPAREALGRVELGAVGEAVVAGRVHGDDVEGLLDRLAGLDEQVAVDRGQREQGRAGVEREAVAGEHASLAADRLRLLADRDLVAERREPGGSGEPTDPGADDHDARHGARAWHARRWSR